MRTAIHDERGIAFPMAMIVMAILTALMAAFAVLATSEPQIAANHEASTQARAAAEAGLERAVWALTAGEDATPPSGALTLDANFTLPNPVPAPYDGSQFVSAGSLGGFTVTVAAGPQVNQKVVTAVGYVPNNTSPVAIKKLTAIVTRVKWINPKCALCAGAEAPPGTVTEVQVAGNAQANATTQSQPGNIPAGTFCSGVTPTAAVASAGVVNTNGSPGLYSPDGLGGTETGVLATEPAAIFPETMTLTDSDMATMKAIAKARGTYYQGPVTFTSPPPSGVIFIDTPSGNPLTPSSPSSDMPLPLVDIHGNWSSDQSWSGWMIVAGTAWISGQTHLKGLIYAQNDIKLNGTGSSYIEGAVISTNRVDQQSTQVGQPDTMDIGNAPIVYNCPAVRNGGGAISQNWFVTPGTYREISGQ